MQPWRTRIQQKSQYPTKNNIGPVFCCYMILQSESSIDLYILARPFSVPPCNKTNRSLYSNLLQIIPRNDSILAARLAKLSGKPPAMTILTALTVFLPDELLSSHLSCGLPQPDDGIPSKYWQTPGWWIGRGGGRGVRSKGPPTTWGERTSGRSTHRRVLSTSGLRSFTGTGTIERNNSFWNMSDRATRYRCWIAVDEEEGRVPSTEYGLYLEETLIAVVYILPRSFEKLAASDGCTGWIRGRGAEER